MRAMASAAVSMWGSRSGGRGAWLVSRRRRLIALRRPPWPPALRHAAMLMLKYGLLWSRFMAPRFIDRAPPRIKRKLGRLSGPLPKFGSGHFHFGQNTSRGHDRHERPDARDDAEAGRCLLADLEGAPVQRDQRQGRRRAAAPLLPGWAAHPDQARMVEEWMESANLEAIR